MLLEEKDVETARKIHDEIKMSTLTRPMSIREFELLLAYELQTCSESLVGRSLYRPFRWIKSKNIELYSLDERVDSDRLVRDVQRRLRIFGIDGLKVHEVEEDISKKLRKLSHKGTFSQHRLTQSLNCLRKKNIIPDGAYVIVTRSVHIPRYTSSSRLAFGVGDPVYGIILLESDAHLIPNNLDGVSVVKNDVGHEMGHLLGYIFHHSLHNEREVRGLHDSVKQCDMMQNMIRYGSARYCDKCKYGIRFTSSLLGISHNKP